MLENEKNKPKLSFFQFSGKRHLFDNVSIIKYGHNELKQLQIIGIAQLQKRILVEYVPNDTLIAVKIAYRWP